MIFDIDGIESKIGYVFSNKMLLRQCFTHSSYAHEHGEDDNELLEFFGDSIIQFIVTEHLYKNSAGDEGKLTEKRKDIVSKTPLLEAVKKLCIAEYVLLGKGQEKFASLDEKLFSSVYESLVAGIYIDGGLKEAKNFIKKTIIADFEIRQKTLSKIEEKAEYKTEIQEYAQGKKIGVISYELLGRSGPDHLPEFRVAVLLNGVRLAEGKGASKKTAEANAARSALNKLKNTYGEKVVKNKAVTKPVDKEKTGKKRKQIPKTSK